MKIYLGGHLNFYHPRKEKWLDIGVVQATALTAILDENEIPRGEVHLVVINGSAVEIDTAVVSDQDEVKIYSAVDGG